MYINRLTGMLPVAQTIVFCSKEHLAVKGATMRRFRMTRRSALVGMMLVALILTATVFAQTIAASSNAKQIRAQTFQPRTLHQLISAHQLASTVQVLASQPPSVIIQFPLFPSGVKKAFPNASGVVTIVQGNPAVS